MNRHEFGEMLKDKLQKLLEIKDEKQASDFASEIHFWAQKIEEKHPEFGFYDNNQNPISNPIDEAFHLTVSIDHYLDFIGPTREEVEQILHDLKKFLKL